jgi:hypothetical protein
VRKNKRKNNRPKRKDRITKKRKIRAKRPNKSLKILIPNRSQSSKKSLQLRLRKGRNIKKIKKLTKRKRRNYTKN